MKKDRRKTLLLSPWYLPIAAVHWQDAVALIYKERADVLVTYSETIRSPSVEWAWPAVVRLRRLDRFENGCRFSPKNVFIRDHNTCQYCRERFEPADLTLDHVVPKSAGGRRWWTNIVACCSPCNKKKGKKSCDEAGMWPMHDPIVPTYLPPTTLQVRRDDAPNEWQEFLDGWAL